MSIQSHSWNIIAREGLPRDTRFPLGTIPEPPPVTPPDDLSVLRAFPGAEGSGALSVGGRDGQVIYVNSLADTNTQGTLRWACTRNYPRIVVFRVAGTIVTGSDLFIDNPYITIAGQTAPGLGIQVRGDPNRPSTEAYQGLLRIRAPHVVVRYLKLRRGTLGRKGGNLGIMDRSGGSSGHVIQHVIVDHVSAFWTENQNLSIWGNENSPHSPRRITVQNSIFAEGLARPNALIGSALKEQGELMSDIDLHSNLFANSTHRNPTYRPESGRFINNIIYNIARAFGDTPARWWMRTGSGTRADIIGNYFRLGQFATVGRAEQEIDFYQWHPNMESAHRMLERQVQVYVAGNWGENSGMTPDTDNWPYTARVGQSGGNSNVDMVPAPESYKRSPYTELEPEGISITVRDAYSLPDYLIPHVGDSMRLTGAQSGPQWADRRDFHDLRLISEYNNRTGIVSPAHEDLVGGFTSIPSANAYACQSGDGIADGWKLRNGLNPALRYNATIAGTAQVGPEIPGLGGWTYMDLFLAGMDIPN